MAHNLTYVQSDRQRYDNAKMVIWNPAVYKPSEIREAAVFVLGTLAAKDEDVQQAQFVLVSGLC